MSYKTTFAALTLGALTSLAAMQAMAAQADHVSVENPFAREVPPGAPASASFMKLTNNSGADINIIQADSAVSKVVELHTHTNDNGVMRMRKIPQITVPANGSTELKPGGLHIMLIGPHEPLKTGQTVNVTLKFEDGSSKEVAMPVKSLKGMGMMKPKMDHSQMDHGHMMNNMNH
ncbi:MAG: copper chaperone PCu(A)C [Thiotrichales bacterium]|nr:copper chaperone PCu(A)C [Thiotrichales bacterium]